MSWFVALGAPLLPSTGLGYSPGVMRGNRTGDSSRQAHRSASSITVPSHAAPNETNQPRMSKTVRLLTDVKLFMRFEYMTFAAILPLIGASSVSARLSGREILGLIAAAVSFHIYVSLLNDVADLSLDRIDPRRTDYPLVRGAVLPSQALAVAFVQIPIAVALTIWLDGPGWAYAALALGLGLMTVYDLFGKRLPFPPLVDVIQGVGFSAMVLYGAAIAGNPTRLTVIVFLLVVVWMVLTNLLGGLRDLRADLQFGVNTTPIFMGARSMGTRQDIPSQIGRYACAVQLILTGIELLALFYNDFGYTPFTQGILVIVVFSLGLIGVSVLATLFRAAADNREVMMSAMGVQLASSSLAALLLFAPYIHVSLLLVMGVVFLLSFGDFSPGPILRYMRTSTGDARG
jgi:4-hydroxybenzoate polyprenyltransferase